MTLRDLLREYPDRFYRQEWYADERFLDGVVDESFTRPPAHGLRLQNTAVAPVTAATLAKLYIEFPNHPIWSRYLWCSDRDAHGQQVYVGDNGKGLEIHRHIHLTERFGVPAWN